MFNPAELRGHGGEWTSGAAGVSLSSPSNEDAKLKLPAGDAPDVANPAPAPVPAPAVVKPPQGNSLADGFARSMAMNADDVVMIALKGVIAKNPAWFAVLHKFVASGRLAKLDAASSSFVQFAKLRKFDISEFRDQFRDQNTASEQSPGLAKFNPNEERGDDGRWSAAAGAGVVGAAAAGGGAIGAAGAALGLRRARGRAFGDAKAAAAPVAAARHAVAARLATRAARHKAAADSIEQGLRQPKTRFLPTAIRGLTSQARRAETHTQHLEAVLGARDFQASFPDSDFQSLFPDVEFGEAFPTDFRGSATEMVDALTAQRKLGDQIVDLKVNGRALRRRPVAGSKPKAHVETYQRPRVVRRVRWDTTKVEAKLKADPAHFAALGIHTVADAEAMALRTSTPEMVALGLPAPRFYQDIVRDTVRNADRVQPAHSRKLEGYPDAPGRKRLADQIRADVSRRSGAFAAGEKSSLKATHPVTQARFGFRNNGGLAALRRLAFLRQHGKAGIIGAGLLVGAAAGATAYGLLRHQSPGDNSKPDGRLTPRLAKAAPTDPLPNSSQQTAYEASAGIEDTLADKLARTFGRWTQIPADQLAAGGDILRDRLQADLQRATAPLDTAAEGGAAADVGVLTADRDGTNRIVTMTLDAGSQKVRDFSQAYRVKLAGNMADEQLATVQSVLQDATLQGQAPAVTARILRQTIGLTPYQAGHVISFRRQLETLDPNVLGRALRDKRYDKTVSRAILQSDPLSDDQVDSMTTAYHRRYLAYRAMTIARTEGLRSANNGHAVAIEDFTDEHPGFSVVKTWMSTEDSKTRADHVALNGQQVVGMQTPFIVPGNGDQILWPHHPDAPLRQVVNCRCTFTTSLVPRTTVAQRGFQLVADAPGANFEDALA
jgi:hypothetical protein